MVSVGGGEVSAGKGQVWMSESSVRLKLYLRLARASEIRPIVRHGGDSDASARQSKSVNSASRYRVSQRWPDVASSSSSLTDEECVPF